jgi:hypothetical protein
MTVFERLHMPSLGGATEWLNSEPLGPAELRGHIVLVNFWTRTPRLRASRAAALQPLGPGRRVDDHARARPARTGRWHPSTPATPTSCSPPERASRFPFRVVLDGEAPGLSLDVDENGNGLLRDGRPTSLSAGTTPSATKRSRSSSSGPAPSHMCSHSARYAD